MARPIHEFPRPDSYDFDQKSKELTWLDKKIPESAADLLSAHGLAPIDAAYRLSNIVPSIISCDFDAGASHHQLLGMLMDLLQAIRVATPATISVSKEEWIAARGKQRRVSVSGHQRGTRALSQEPEALALLPELLPSLPRGFVGRSAVLGRATRALLGAEAETPQRANEAPTLVLQGMVSPDLCFATNRDDLRADPVCPPNLRREEAARQWRL